MSDWLPAWASPGEIAPSCDDREAGRPRQRDEPSIAPGGNQGPSRRGPRKVVREPRVVAPESEVELPPLPPGFIGQWGDVVYQVASQAFLEWIDSGVSLERLVVLGWVGGPPRESAVQRDEPSRAVVVRETQGSLLD